MNLPRALEWIGLHARVILLAGLVVVPLLPQPHGLLIPLLPALVSLLTGLAIARLDLRDVLRDLVVPRRVLPILAGLVLIQPVAALAAHALGQWIGLGAGLMLVLVAFAASPPLSSAPNIALMLGYDARLALLHTLIGTLLAPLLVPAALWLAEAGIAVDPGAIALKVLAMLAGGLALGLLLRRVIGPARLAAHGRAMDGVAALAMLAFLFPLMDGVLAEVMAHPGLALILALMALALNLGTNLLLRGVLARLLPTDRARAIGLLFGNRNISVLLAALPHDPTFSLFVALGQIPIYVTPLILSTLDRKHRCQPSLES